MKVLIVDDDFTSRLLLQELLKPHGDSHIATNGREAVQAVRAAHERGEPYDLICLDIMMPEMDGHEALQEIRAEEAARQLPPIRAARILMTTALDDFASVRNSYYGLCDTYLVKPIRAAQLTDELRRMELIA